MSPCPMEWPTVEISHNNLTWPWRVQSNLSYSVFLKNTLQYIIINPGNQFCSTSFGVIVDFAAIFRAVSMIGTAAMTSSTVIRDSHDFRAQSRIWIDTRESIPYVCKKRYSSISEGSVHITRVRYSGTTWPNGLHQAIKLAWLVLWFRLKRNGSISSLALSTCGQGNDESVATNFDTTILRDLEQLILFT